MNPHKVLEIAAGASEKEIKDAYKKLAKKYHPDLNGGDKAAEAKFKEISEAYSMLTDKPKSTNNQGFDFQDVNMDDVNSIFSTIFGARGFAGNNTTQTINRVPVDPLVFITGGVFDYTVQLYENQNGRLRPVHKKVKITIEPDTPVGSRIAVPNTHPHHIFIELVPVDTDRLRVVDGFHLCENMTIDAFQAMAGCSIETVSPNGKKIAVKVPAGTQYGAMHRIRGMGLKHPNGSRGDYIVQFLVVIPSVTDEEDLKTRFASVKNLEKEKS